MARGEKSPPTRWPPRGLLHITAQLPATAPHIPSSCREWVKEGLPRFREANPQLELAAELRPGNHPHLIGVYREYSSRLGSRSF